MNEERAVGGRTSDIDTASITWGRDLVREFAQAVLEQAAPEELLLFEETFDDYSRDPAAVLDPKKRDEAVGFGLDLALLTPYVLAVAAPVLTFLAQTVAGVVKEESERLLTDAVRRLFRGAGLEVPAVKTHEDAALAVTPAQAEEVRKIVLARAEDLRLPESQARLLADSVVGGLVTVGN